MKGPVESRLKRSFLSMRLRAWYASLFNRPLTCVVRAPTSRTYAHTVVGVALAQRFLRERFGAVLQKANHVEFEVKLTRHSDTANDSFSAAVELEDRRIGFLTSADAARLDKWADVLRHTDLTVFCAARVTKYEDGFTEPYFEVFLDLPWPRSFVGRASFLKVVADCAGTQSRVLPL